MKGYNLNGTLYIFDATPATIPGSAGDEADVIYVQQELVEEFKTYNPDNSAKIMPYNYKLLAVNKLPWADYVNEDIPESEPETNSITASDIDENTGLFGTITVSLSSPEPLVTEYEEGNDYSPFEAANTLYISSGDLTDTTKYSWTKDGEPIEGVEATGDDREPLIYTYDNNGEDGPMFTVEENEEGSTATITPNETGLFVVTAVTAPETQYTVNVNFGQTLLENLPDGLPFDPSMPYSATEGTELVFTLPFDSDWYQYRDTNNETPYYIQVQSPESIQGSFGYTFPDMTLEDPDNPDSAPIQVDGSLSFIMPAEDVTLDIDLVENESYIEPEEPVYNQLTVVNNLPSNYRLEVKYLYDQEEPDTIDDISSSVDLPHDSRIYVYAYDDNNNLVNVSPTDSADYYTSHADAQAMVDYHAYCTIGVDESDTEILGSYGIFNAADSAIEFGAGESFVIYGDVNLTVEVPTVNS